MLKVLFVGSEAVPFVKVGGMGDVIGALAKELSALGINVRIVIPKFVDVQKNIQRLGLKSKRVEPVAVFIDGKEEFGQIEEYRYQNITYYIIDNPDYYARNGLYFDRQTKQEYHDNLRRFVFFNKVALETAKIFDFQPDIVHTHDWQTGLVPIYLKTIYKFDSFYQSTKSVITAHNLSYQGIFPVEQFTLTGLDWKYFTVEGLEYYGHLNLLKGGIVFSDITITVSETYAKEIQSPEYGNGLEGIMINKANNNKLFGIVNGVDYSEWDPENDKYLKDKFGIGYSATTLENKLKIKEKFLKEAGVKKPDLSKPLIGAISRLIDQKGWDILMEIIEPLLEQDVYFTVLGTGKQEYENRLKELAEKYPQKALIKIKFDIPCSHYIEAASDIFLMPSRFEPCGMNQLYSLRYGTITVVRNTGGLADTVKNGKTGFIFNNYNPDDLISTIKKAIDIYCNSPEKWKKMMQSAMKEDWSWKKSAKSYINLYKDAVSLNGK